MLEALGTALDAEGLRTRLITGPQAAPASPRTDPDPDPRRTYRPCP
jgi:hypothetical protein